MLFLPLISLPMTVCLFWAVFLLLRMAGEPSVRPTDKQMLLFFTAALLLYGCHFLYFAGYGSTAGETLYAAMNLCVYPLFFRYLATLTGNKEAKRTGLWLFLPALCLPAVLPILLTGGHEKAVQICHTAGRTCFLLQVAYVWVRGHNLLRDYRTQLDNTYADDRSYQLRHVTILLQLLGATAIISAGLSTIGREFFYGHLTVIIPALLMTMLLYGLGYTTSLIHIPEEEHEESTDTTSEGVTEEEDARQMRIRLEEYMASEPYKDPNFTIYDLARGVRTNRTYISNFINQQYGVNFSTFIADLRIEHAKKVLADKNWQNSKNAIGAAMLQSGFLSETTFYRLFKQKTGVSPRQFRIQALGSKAEE
jgi:AraC-like DNA-binding protein